MSKPASKKKSRRLLLGAAVAILLCVVGWHVTFRLLSEEYETFERPDGLYKVVVYRTPTLFSMPGGSGAAPGYVRLYDREGRVLGEQSVDMVQNVDQVYWGDGSVDVKFVAEWKLPTR